MKCAWKDLLSILPAWMRLPVDKVGRESCQEVRLRLGIPPEIVMYEKHVWLDRQVTRDDLNQCINSASRYSPWNSTTAGQGYLTAPGGHRIGICGEGIIKNGILTGFREVRSLCIRVARDYPGIAGELSGKMQSVLIIGAPGWGKTTLLRDLIRGLSNLDQHIAVVDERGELFPSGPAFSPGKCSDVLCGCSKREGIEVLLRTMGPDWIAVDEITAGEDCEALLKAAYCGVKLAATAHAGSLDDFKKRPVYRPLVESGLFHHVMVLRQDKSWILERMGK